MPSPGTLHSRPLAARVQRPGRPGDEPVRRCLVRRLLRSGSAVFFGAVNARSRRGVSAFLSVVCILAVTRSADGQKRRKPAINTLVAPGDAWWCSRIDDLPYSTSVCERTEAGCEAKRISFLDDEVAPLRTVSSCRRQVKSSVLVAFSVMDDEWVYWVHAETQHCVSKRKYLMTGDVRPDYRFVAKCELVGAVRSTVPKGRGWFCFAAFYGASSDGFVSGCERSVSECEDALLGAVPVGQAVSEAVLTCPQLRPFAWAAGERAFPRAEACEAFREENAQPDFASCAVVR